MLKVLLVLEDYNEMTYLQSTLRKIGFDTEGINKTTTISSQILMFRPNVIVITASSTKINGYQVSKDIKVKNPEIAFVLVKHGKQDFIDRLVEDGEIDSAVDSPVNISTLVKTMDAISHFNLELVLDKMKKLSTVHESEVDVINIKNLDALAKKDLPVKVPGRKMEAEETRGSVPVVRTESENEESRGGIVEKVSKQQESNSASIISDEAENNINGQEFNSGGEKGPGGASTGDPSVDSPDEIVELSELAGFKAQSDSDDGVGTADGGENGDVRKENGSAKVVFTAEQFKKFNSSSIGDNERKINFDDFVSKAKLDGKELVKSFYSRNRIREFTKMIRKIDSEEDLTELHSDKRDFVKMLFKKK